ncbi:hypothetical protein [Bradyrhizobium japonicum]|uniref:hypothetical protein n=1 Tax=Bradyrhizobium japonicum TaxID=375 RepID=UPI00200E6799|nr:hypothetical protein [Bradyrhizobium japonicum]UQD96060.1 hypothetical protein JEY30_31455 [Bradyrhizobium japonicum]
MANNTPYADATSGVAARDEITRLLRRFGCESIGFMDDFEKHEVLLAFRHRGRSMQLRASAKGWAIETGILSFEAVFFPYMLTNSGQPVYERAELLSLLEGPQ